MDKEGDKVNEDARENHTLRNALLLTAGIAGMASGAKAGIKLMEKDIVKGSKAVKKTVNNAVEHTAKTESTVKKTIDNTTGSTESSVIKTGPPVNVTTNTKNAKTTAEKIKDRQKLVDSLVEQFEAEKNPALKEKLKKQIEAIKTEIASYQLGNKK